MFLFYFNAFIAAVETPSEDPASDLDQCLTRMAKGDLEALSTLYQQTKSALYGFALSILRHPQDAEDILQEAYLHIYQNAARYQPGTKPLAWMFTITRNLALMKLRQQTHQMDFTEEQWENYFTDTMAFTSEDRMVLSALLHHLSSEERQIVVLHAISGFKHREIAALLKLPLPTVLSKYHRALKKLQHVLEG